MWTEKARGSALRVAQELVYMSNLAILDIETYADTVSKKRIAAKASRRSAGLTRLKNVCRSQKRRICRLETQNKKLRINNKALRKINKALLKTNSQLRAKVSLFAS